MKTFEARVLCTIIKLVRCEAESLEDVEADPWEFAVDETEIDQVDWEVLSAKEVE